MVTPGIVQVAYFSAPDTAIHGDQFATSFGPFVASSRQALASVQEAVDGAVDAFMSMAAKFGYKKIKLAQSPEILQLLVGLVKDVSVRCAALPRCAGHACGLCAFVPGGSSVLMSAGGVLRAVSRMPVLWLINGRSRLPWPANHLRLHTDRRHPQGPRAHVKSCLEVVAEASWRTRIVACRP